MKTRTKKPSRMTCESAARARWGDDVEVFGHLTTIGPASSPYARDGAKVFRAIVRTKDWRSQPEPFLISVSAPTAAEAWVKVMASIHSCYECGAPAEPGFNTCHGCGQYIASITSEES